MLGLTERGAAALEVITVAPLGKGAAVVFRQRFGNLAAGRDGLLSVGVRDGAVWYVSSSLARDAGRAGSGDAVGRRGAQRIAVAGRGRRPDARCGGSSWSPSPRRRAPRALRTRSC